MKEKGNFPDKGAKHAVLIVLFNGRKTGRVVTKEMLKEAIAKDHKDNQVFISDDSVNVVISGLREAFREHAPEFHIRNRKRVGYDLIKDTDNIKQNL